MAFPDVLPWPDNDPRLTALRVAARFEANYRVASRFAKIAMEFPTEKALKTYLKDHPDADPSKHSVAKPKEEKKTEEHKEEEDEEAPKKTWKERLKSLSEKAQNFVKAAPKEVKSFITNPAARRKALIAAHKTLEEAPEKMVKSFIKAAKEEVEEFKEAGEGIKTVLKGGKMSKHQKKAFKKVAFHVALTVAAVALTTSGGPLAAAAGFGKSMVKHVAMKAASNALAHVHVLEEVGHISHGLAHIVTKLAAEETEKAPKMKNDEAVVKLVMAAVAKELEKLDDEDTISEVLEKMEEEKG